MKHIWSCAGSGRTGTGPVLHPSRPLQAFLYLPRSENLSRSRF